MEAAPGNAQHECISHVRERRPSLERSPQDFAKGAKPAFDAPVLAALVFSVKTFAAAMLALYISFWLGLDEPYWALLTVFIVAQPDSGLVLAKGFYRLLGTAAGILVSTALVFAFAQYGEFFVASIAAWIGVCSFAARGTRNFASYGFQLAGYTAAIVGIPAALNPHGAYTVIVARSTEITLGIGCAALVSRLIFPRHLTPKLIGLANRLFHHVERFAEVAMDPAAGRKQLASEREGLAEEFGAVEAMRSSAYFESADARLVSQPLRDAVHAAVDLYSIAEAAALHPCPDLEDSPYPDSPITDAGRASHVDDQTVFELRRAADTRTLTRARARLDECATALAKGEGLSKSTPVAPLWSDPITAVVTGTRSALAIVITAGFWFLTAWPSGPVAVIAAGVACTLLAPTQDPAKITAAAGATVLVFAIPLFVTQICLLPYALDFFSMAAVLTPYLVTCAFVIAHPKIGPLGLLAAVYLAVTSHIDNNTAQTYDVVSFFNASLAILLGFGVSAVLFATFFPETPRWAARRFSRQVRVHMSRLAASTRPVFSAFDFALCEQLASTLARVKDEPALASDCLLEGAVGLSSACAIERLRTGMVKSSRTDGIYGQISELLAGLSHLYLRPSPARVTRGVWEARVASRRLLAKARAADKPTDREELLDLAVACEALRSGLMKIRDFMREERNVH
ncbi:MAG: FUSC family protein [Xanthobacteraceae bacterium]